MAFIPYPDISDPMFYDKIFWKKEFNKTLYGPDFQFSETADMCSKGEFKMQNHQEFVRNFLSPETPYNGALLFHGTGVGKCVHPDTLIYANGTTVRIDDLWNQYAGDLVITDNNDGGEFYTCKNAIIINTLKDGKLIPCTVSKLYRQKISEPLVKITTEYGDTIRITSAHKLLTPTGWTNNLTNISRVAQPMQLQNDSHISIDNSLAYLLGWQISEGHERQSNDVYITNNDITVLEQLKEKYIELALTNNFKTTNPNIHVTADRSPYLRITCSDYREYLEHKGYVWGNLSADKVIPDFIQKSDDQNMTTFLRAYFDAESHVNVKLRRIEISSASFNIILAIKHMLLRFGIMMRINTKEKCATNGSLIFRTYYEGTISSENLRMYNSKIGYELQYKKNAASTICECKINPNIDLYDVNELLREIKAYTNLPNEIFVDKMYLLYNKKPSKCSLIKIIDNLKQVCNGNYKLPVRGTQNRIIDDKLAIFISQLEFELNKQYGFYGLKSYTTEHYDGYVYDLEVPETHNYVANGIICHNTCAAIGISEGLRDYVHKNGKKIYILSSENIRPNFYKELYDSERATIETEHHSPPGSYQCAGDRYYVEGAMNEKTRIRAVHNIINKYYEFFGFSQFANFVDIGLGAAIPVDAHGKPKTRPKIADVDIGDYFMNSVIIIDEVHGVAGEGKRTKVEKEEEIENDDLGEEPVEDDEGDFFDEDVTVKGKKTERFLSKRPLLKVLLDTVIPECRKKGGHIKLILMSATPMKDNYREIADLLELFNTNDGRPLEDDWRRKLSVGKDEINIDLLRKLSRGYISYVKGNNPISFPLPLLPPANDIYNPTPIFSYIDGKTNVEADFQISLDPEGQHHYVFDLVNCSMSMYQFKCYWALRTLANPGDAADTNARQIVNMVFPESNRQHFDELRYSDSHVTSDVKLLYGSKGFNNSFTTSSVEIGLSDHKDSKEGRKKKMEVYSITDDIWKNYGPFLMQNNVLYDDVDLKTFSAKFSKMTDYINRSPGISYVYSEFIPSGALIMALILESNGYVRYTPELERVIDKKTGLPQQDLEKIVPTSKLLRYTTGQKEALTSAGIELDTHYMCARCGQLYDNCITSSDGHKFTLATYIIVTGQHGGIDDLDYVTRRGNERGDRVKVVLGTQVTGQGVDLKWVRQVHITDPWHNNTRIYQAIGRGIRHCSHADLAPHERNVTIFRYSASTTDIEANSGLESGLGVDPDIMILTHDTNGDMVPSGITYGNLKTETIDEHMYRRVVRKELFVKRIERTLKENSVDCALNRNRNIFATDKDYSRECDYQKCFYPCSGYQNEPQFLQIRIRRYADIFGNDAKWLLEDSSGQEQPVDALIEQPIIIEALQYMNISKKERIVTNADVWKIMRRRVHKLDHREETTTVEFPNDIYIKKYGSDYTIKISTDDFVPFILDDITSYEIPQPVSEVHTVDEYWEWLMQQEETIQMNIEKIPVSDYLAIDVPKGQLDGSTYNVYFAAPQIDKAEKHISRIFQDQIAMTVERIIYYVQKRDPSIDTEFIYGAIDALVGNPPFIKPKLFTDKFGRKGYIIFRNKYYIFQPVELKNTNIPLQYRKEPLTIKSRFYDLNLLDQGAASSNIFDKEYQPDATVVDQFIQSLNIEYYDITRIIGAYMNLDRQHPTVLIMVLEQILQAFIDEGAISIDKYHLAAIIAEYFMRSGLLYCLYEGEKDASSIQDLLLDPTVTIVHILRYSTSSENILSYYNRDLKKWNIMNMSIDTPQKHMLINAWQNNITYPSIFTGLTTEVFVQLYAPMHGYMATTSSTRNLAPSDKPEEILGIIKKHYIHYPDQSTLQNVVFKIIDTSRQQIRTTKMGIISNKSVTRGHTCANLQLIHANSSFNSVQTFYRQIYEAYDMPNPEALSSDKLTICNQIERMLRMLDLIRYNPENPDNHDRRWFLSPLETEYYYRTIQKK